MKNFKTVSTTMLGAALLLAGNLPVHATTIGINFTAGARLLSAFDQPGFVPGANWNNEIGFQGTNLALLDSLGGATTAKLTYNSTSASDAFTGTNTANAATN